MNDVLKFDAFLVNYKKENWLCLVNILDCLRDVVDEIWRSRKWKKGIKEEKNEKKKKKEE